MRVRPLAAALLGGSLLLAACSSFDGSSPDTTTGTVDRNETTTTTSTTTTAPRSTTTQPEGSGLGLWIASPAGIEDEGETRWASPAAGETLRDPVDDAAGGVFYLRCPQGQTGCVIEHQRTADGTPEVVTDGQDLLAVGTLGGKRVLLSVWKDPTITPSFEQNTSGLVARAIDVETRAVVGTYSWFGWESGPFVADVEQDRFVVCTGEGESCELSTFQGAAGPTSEVPGGGLADVSSLALDGSGRVLTWVTRGDGGAIAVHRFDLGAAAGASADERPLSGAADPAPDEAVTDGAWVAVRTGAKVQAYELAAATDPSGAPSPSAPSPGATTPQQPPVELDVPADTTQIAIRLTGASPGVASSL